MADYEEKTFSRYRSDTHSAHSDSPTSSKRTLGNLECKVSYRRRVVAFKDQLGNISASLQSPLSVEEETGKPTADLIMPEHSIFGQELKQHFDAVLYQSENGVRVTNIMMDYFNEISEAYRNFTDVMGSIAKSKLSKLKEIQNKGDRMDSTFNKCCKFLEHSSTLSQKYGEHNEKLYNKVISDFSEFQKKHLADAKEVNRRAKIMKSGMEKQTKLVLAEKSSAIKFLNMSASKKLGTVNKKTSKKKKLSVEEETTITNLNLEALDKYKKNCRSANEYANLNRFCWWPAVLKRVQLREEARINQIRKTLNIFTENEKSAHNAYVELSMRLEQDLKDCDSLTKDDITGFVSHCQVDMPKDSDKARRDFIPRYSFEILNDDITISDDSKNTDAKTKTIPHDDRKIREQPSLFNNTLNNIMAYQEKESATLSSGTDIPIIVDFLVSALIKIGCNSEGIFRISPEQIRTEVEELRRKFESGHYVLSDGISPHVVAALLHLWFQRLSEPVFPYIMYDTCMRVAKERKGLNTDSQEEEFNSLLNILNDNKMPAVNRRTLIHLLKLLSLLATNENRTMMSVRDLGCVFAPTFFHGPSPSAKLNAVQAMDLTNNSLYLFERLVALYNVGIHENIGGKVVIGDAENESGIEGKNHSEDVQKSVEGESEGIESKSDGKSDEIVVGNVDSGSLEGSAVSGSPESSANSEGAVSAEVGEQGQNQEKNNEERQEGELIIQPGE